MLDHILLLDDRHLDSLARQYMVYFNDARPHQGIEQRVPPTALSRSIRPNRSGWHLCSADSMPTTGGLHDHENRQWTRMVASTAAVIK
jgi:hypothetical protein